MKKAYLQSLLALALAAALLFGANLLSAHPRARRAQRAHVALMQSLLPGSETLLHAAYTGDDPAVRSVHSAENGCIVETVVQGYAGEIRMMTAVNALGRVAGLTVLDLQETHGLGRRVLRDRAFLSQFLNTDGNATIAAPADGVASATANDGASAAPSASIDALTGATVTSKAVAKSVHCAVAAARVCAREANP